MKKLLVLVVVLSLVGAAGWSQKWFESYSPKWMISAWSILTKAANHPDSVSSSDMNQIVGFLAYVAGIAKFGSAIGALDLPYEVTPLDLVTVVGKYMDKHPDQAQNVDSPNFVFLALYDRYPGNWPWKK